MYVCMYVCVCVWGVLAANSLMQLSFIWKTAKLQTVCNYANGAR